MTKKIQLTLYITGDTPRSQLAIANLKRICEEVLCCDYDLSVVDVIERPHLAEQERILATPTLIKTTPLPLRRVIGDLSDTKKVLMGLGLTPGKSE